VVVVVVLVLLTMTIAQTAIHNPVTVFFACMHQF